MIDIEFINKAIARCEHMRADFPAISTFVSIRNQLEYIKDVFTGKNTDKSKLGEIIIGVQAAREIENIDEDFAEMLHDISAWVDENK
ncbi:MULTISPECIES: immunity protein Tsi6 family protein [Nitrospirillum]|uniref:Tsi6 domain-containing protein n=1 Tax=Nitrospirillum amazonense TaxID=28077 RepID=A0A560EXW8_9PROT|nr:immunity protein Tsi6 family protein [Nitrospirillum amazonense]MEC4594654.1 immunity protein Tsi6 family protein [Nitrospirillum amazonense]TWB14075.1 hypothetical protein FBZ88_1331 [Nitrospirillum amazonense]